MPRKNIFQRHERGAEVEAKLAKGMISQREAARILGCSEANISQLTSKWAVKKARKAPSAVRPSELSQITDLAQFKKFTMEIDGTVDMEVLAPLSWNAIWQGLLMLSQRELEPEEYVKIANTLIRMMQFQFSKDVPGIKQKPITLDRATEDRLIKRLGDYCEQCPFRREFIQRKAQKQSKSRMVAEQSAPVG